MSIYLTIDYDNLDIIEFLLNLSVNLYINYDDDCLSLHIVIDHLEMIKMLLKANTLLDCQYKMKKTILYISNISTNHISFIEILLEADVDFHIFKKNN